MNNYRAERLRRDGRLLPDQPAKPSRSRRQAREPRLIVLDELPPVLLPKPRTGKPARGQSAPVEPARPLFDPQRRGNGNPWSGKA